MPVDTSEYSNHDIQHVARCSDHNYLKVGYNESPGKQLIQLLGAIMSWPTFCCDEPDVFVRSTRDDPPAKFGAHRKALSGSDVFRTWLSPSNSY